MYTPRPTKKTRGANTQRKTRMTSAADRDPPPPLIRFTPDNPRFNPIPIINYEANTKSSREPNHGERERETNPYSESIGDLRRIKASRVIH